MALLFIFVDKGWVLHNWLFFMDVCPLKVLERSFICSASSRYILVPFERYGCPKKYPQKSIVPQMHWTSNIFWHSVATIGVFWTSLNYSILNFKKTVCPKNVWMRHWYARFIFNNYRSFVNSLLQLVRSYVVIVFTYVKVATVKLRKTKSYVMQLLSLVRWMVIKRITAIIDENSGNQLETVLAARKILFKNNTLGMSVTWPTAVFSKIYFETKHWLQFLQQVVENISSA